MMNDFEVISESTKITGKCDKGIKAIGMVVSARGQSSCTCGQRGNAPTDHRLIR